MAMRREVELQGDLLKTWVEMSRSSGHVLYDRLQKLLSEVGFDLSSWASRPRSRPSSKILAKTSKSASHEAVVLHAPRRCPCRKLYPTGAKPRIGRCSITWGIMLKLIPTAVPFNSLGIDRDRGVPHGTAPPTPPGQETAQGADPPAG